MEKQLNAWGLAQYGQNIGSPWQVKHVHRPGLWRMDETRPRQNVVQGINLLSDACRPQAGNGASLKQAVT